jgi:hypothetical protein
MTVAQSAMIEDARRRLIDHPLYDEISAPDDVKIFMKHHVFAVWDFFSLLKRLQTEVTCTTVPWMPKPFAAHGRFIVEIALAEETDEDLGGGYTSHFDLYRRAMAELGADDSLIEGYFATIALTVQPIAALSAADLPPTIQRFVGSTLNTALHGQPHEVAASFCHGRENLLPDVLGALRDGLQGLEHEMPVFQHYLERHITLDHDEHGPLALKLLDALCGDDDQRRTEAELAGVAAIEARIGLWDGVLAEIRQARTGANA